MIPLKDDIPSRSTPVVNVLLIVVTSLMFLSQLGETGDGPGMVERYGMIPARVLHSAGDPPVEIVEPVVVRTPFGPRVEEHRRPAAPAGVPDWLTLLTCVFLHGGWAHFLGNMWFLWIFGDNVEDRFGHLGYAAFYLGSGVLASLSHLLTATGSAVPTIGASGAIAGVMGAYLFLYPRARVLTIVPIFVIIQFMTIPAPVFLGLWFLLQLWQGAASLGDVASGGVAWWAHIGGFAVGFAIAWFLRKEDHLRPPVEIIPPGAAGPFAPRPPRRRPPPW